jgi:hypothetical protein
MEKKSLEQIKKHLKKMLKEEKKYKTDPDAKSWGEQEGILISGNEARLILNALDSSICFPEENIINMEFPINYDDHPDESEHNEKMRQGAKWAIDWIKENNSPQRGFTIVDKNNNNLQLDKGEK